MKSQQIKQVASVAQMVNPLFHRLNAPLVHRQKENTMKERIIYWLLKTCRKEEQVRILAEMVFQLLPKMHLAKNPVRKVRNV